MDVWTLKVQMAENRFHQNEKLWLWFSGECEEDHSSLEDPEPLCASVEVFSPSWKHEDGWPVWEKHLKEMRRDGETFALLIF